jgi:hypothetical protein
MLLSSNSANLHQCCLASAIAIRKCYTFRLTSPCRRFGDLLFKSVGVIARLLAQWPRPTRNRPTRRLCGRRCPPGCHHRRHRRIGHRMC